MPYKRSIGRQNSVSVKIDTSKKMQHNVQNRVKRKFELTNIYRTINPNLILINSQGANTLTVECYNTYNNQFNEPHDESAIPIKKRKTQHRRRFISIAIQATIETSLGIIATTYLLPEELTFRSLIYIK